MKHLMLDLETLGTSVNAPIVQIGMAYFKMNGQVGDTFCQNLSFQNQLDMGAKVDESTLVWWLFQSKEAKQSVFGDPVTSPAVGLREANEFLNKATAIWSHATFDFVILREALRRFGIAPNFHYRTAKDIRTLTHLAGMRRDQWESKPNVGIHHNALDDCLFQIDYVSKCFMKIRDAVGGYDSLQGKYLALREKYRKEN